MWKAVLAGTTAVAIAGSSLVYAQQRQGRPDGMMRRQPNIEDIRAFGEARLAALKAGLALNAEQEKNWPQFEQAARDFGKLRLDRLSARIEARRDAQPRTTDPVERLRRRATAMTETGAALKKLADATDPLYKSLDDAQKRRFAVLARDFNAGRQDRRGRDFRNRDDGQRPDRGPRRMERGPDRPNQGERL